MTDDGTPRTRRPFHRIDLDIRWPYDRKVRRLQSRYPEAWPVYWTAYLALITESWAQRNGTIPLDEAWLHALPCSEPEAREALQAVELLNANGCIPGYVWDRWYIPANERMVRREEAARKAAAARWDSNNQGSTPNQTIPIQSNPIHTTDSIANADQDSTAIAMPTQSVMMGFRPRPKNGSHEGQHPDCTVCDAVRKAPSLADQMTSDFERCAKCTLRRGIHTAANGADHEFISRRAK